MERAVKLIEKLNGVKDLVSRARNAPLRFVNSVDNRTIKPIRQDLKGVIVARPATDETSSWASPS